VRDFSKYFTPLLTSEDRARIGRALGLEAKSWTLEESCGGQVLRRWQAGTGPIWGRPEGTSFDFDLGSLGPQLQIVPFRQAGELWRDFLPFPFRSIPTESDAARDLTIAWGVAESALASFELSLVWVGDETGIPLLFHYVRRRCIRLGTAESLVEIGNYCLSGEWDSAALLSHFGTRTGFFHWSIREAPADLSPLDRLGHTLRASVPTLVTEGHGSALQPQSLL
jgi:hypothetical protein